ALRDGEALLTAHHEDGQLEPVLLQLLRGAGLAGIAAMPARAPLARGFLVRPLLACSRQELLAYLRARGLEWIEDPMNSELRLDRNYLRARVLPAIRERWPAAATTVTRTARHTAEAQRLLDELGRADVARAAFGARLSAKVLRALTPERRRNALRYWITAAGYRPPPARGRRTPDAEARRARAARPRGTPRHAHRPGTPRRGAVASGARRAAPRSQEPDAGGARAGRRARTPAARLRGRHADRRRG